MENESAGSRESRSFQHGQRENSVNTASFCTIFFVNITIISGDGQIKERLQADHDSFPGGPEGFGTNEASCPEPRVEYAARAAGVDVDWIPPPPPRQATSDFESLMMISEKPFQVGSVSK
jgi:hypothetical protein